MSGFLIIFCMQASRWFNFSTGITTHIPHTRTPLYSTHVSASMYIKLYTHTIGLPTPYTYTQSRKETTSIRERKHKRRHTKTYHFFFCSWFNFRKKRRVFSLFFTSGRVGGLIFLRVSPPTSHTPIPRFTLHTCLYRCILNYINIRLVY